jgi:hypothetical protein
MIRVYEPALCCNTGVCGPDPSQALIIFSSDLAHVKERGGDVGRHNLANDPMAFAQEPRVREFMEIAGSDGLPLVMVDGVVVLTGRYPTRSELLRYAGLPDEAELAAPGGCCGGNAQGC